MILILVNMTSDYDLQIVMKEKCILDKLNPLSIDELRDDLNLQFERLTMKASEEIENEILDDLSLLGGQFKGKYRNSGAIGH